MRTFLRGLLFTGLAVLAWSTFGANARAELVTFDFPGVGISTFPQAISNTGVIVGNIIDLGGTRTRGFIRFADGSFSAPIVHPNDNNNLTRALGVNSAGTVVGDFLQTVSGVNTFHGYFLNGSTFTQFDIGGPVSTSIFGINDLGNIAGTFGSFVQPNQGFLRVGPTTTTFAFPGSGVTETFGIALNNSNQVVGQYTDAGGVHGYVRSASGSFTSIDFPGASLTSALGINDSGVIVGGYRIGTGPLQGFLLEGSTFTTFNVPGATSTVIFGINNSGAYTGTFTDATGTHGFVFTPQGVAVPEPGTFALLGIGALGLLGYGWRRRKQAM